MSSKRSGIPVLGKSGIPLKRSNVAASQSRGGHNMTNSTSVGRTERESSLPNVLKVSPTKKSDSDLPKDSKHVEEQISELQKQLEDKDEALRDLSRKLALKTQECDTMEEETGTIRRRTSADLQKVTTDYSHLNETLKEKEKVIQDMESRHAEEKEKIKFELDVLRSEHLIEIEMLKKEVEDMKSKEDRFHLKRGLDLPRRPDSEYDSSDVGSRDQSPAVEAMHEQLLTIQGSYEEEIGALREQLQAQIGKTNEVVEKLEQQEFEFNENLSELKSRLERDRDALAAEHQNDISNVRSMYEERLKLQEDRHKERKLSTSTKEQFEPSGLGSNDVNSARSGDRGETIAALKAEHESYMDAVKEQYEGELLQMKQQLQKKEKQFASREDQMADDMMTMHAEYEKQLSETREESAGLQQVVSQLRSEIQGLGERHEKEKEEVQLKYQEEMEGLQRAQERQGDLREVGKEKEDEMKQLRNELQKERKGFTEVRELLESTITEQEKELTSREEENQKLTESHQKAKENIKTENEKNLQEASERHSKELEKLRKDHEAELKRMNKNDADYSGDEREKEMERLQQEIKELTMRHKQELSDLHQTQEPLRTENKELKSEFDLVIGDLSKELENSNGKQNQITKDSTSPQMLRVQLGNFRELKNEEMRLILEQLDEYKERVSALKGDIGNYKEENNSNKRKIEELERELVEVQKRADESKSHSLQIELERFRKENQEHVNVEEHEMRRVVELEETIEQLKANHSCYVEEYEERITEVQQEKKQVEDRWQKEKDEHEEEMLQLNRKLEELQGKHNAEMTTSKDKISQLTNTINDLQEDCGKYQEEKKRLQSEVTEHRQGSRETDQAFKAQLLSYEENILELTSSIEEMQQDCAVYKQKSLELEDQNEGLRKASSDSKNALTKQLLDSEEKTSQFGKTIGNLKNECREREMENQKLWGKMEQFPSNPNSEAIISSASTQEVFAEKSDFIYEDRAPGGIALQYEQQNKELVEEFENKIEALELQLSESKNALLSKRRQVESVSTEMNALRQNLEDERKAVQNLEERLQKLNVKHETEMKELKEYLAKEALRRQDEVSSGMKSEAKTEEHARNVEVKFLNDRNTELVEEISNLKEDFEEERKRYQADISVARYNLEKSSTNVERLKVALEKKSEITREQEEEVARLKTQLEESRQNHEQMSAVDVRMRQETTAAENLKADLKEARKRNKKKEDELRRLKEQLQEYALKTKKEMGSIEARLKQGYAEDVGSLKADLELALNANGQSEEIIVLKEETRKIRENLAQAGETFSAEKIAVSEEHAQKIHALEQELKSRATEIASLVSLLDTEQKGRERVLLDTEKHLAHVGRTEQEKTTMERECTELRLRAKYLEKELETERNNHSRTLSQVKKKQQNEHEEVLSLNRSFNESEFERGKLVSELEYWKEESNKVQEKYKNLREKFGLLKEKRREDKEKHSELLFTPRSDMGLQTDLLHVEEFEAAKHKASVSLLEQTRLEEDIDSLEHEAGRMKVEMRALRKANDILRKQNQTLYLETESLNSKGEQQRLDLTQLMEENQLLVNEREMLTSETKSLNVVLEEKGTDLDRTKEERSSLDLENKNSQTQLRHSQEREHQLERENAHLKDENVFFVKQAKRLQFQVEQLEKELENSSRNPTAQLVQKRSTLPLMPLEFKPQNEKAWSETVENKKLQEQMEALQKLLILKEQELQSDANDRKAVVESLVKERQDLLAQVDLMKNTQTAGDKGGVAIQTGVQVVEWDKKQDVEPLDITVPLITDVEPLGVHHPKMEFQTSDIYLGTSYWEAMNFLKSVKSPS